MSLPLPDQPRTAVDRVTLAEVPLAVVRHAGVRQSDLRDLFDSSFRAIGAAASAGDLQPTGPAVAIYDGDPADVFDLALGLPVAQLPSGTLERDGVEIVGHQLAAGAYAALSHVGSYEGLSGAWERLIDGVTEGGAQPAGVWVEVYVSEPTPESDPSTLRTDLLVPVVLDDVV
jgi:effector-binding domain-containing protein